MIESKTSSKIAIIGLGYVGLPLAIEFGKKYDVLGFDINQVRIDELENGIDRTKEADLKTVMEVVELRKSSNHKGLHFSSDVNKLKQYNVFIVTVPTPIDNFKAPDLKPLLAASAMIGKVLKEGDVVIYESTVYPGCTEEDCVPILEKHSGLKFNVDFFCGYSPERINPGDKVNTLTTTTATSHSVNELSKRLQNAQKLFEDQKTQITTVTKNTKHVQLSLGELSIQMDNTNRLIDKQASNIRSLATDTCPILSTDINRLTTELNGALKLIEQQSNDINTIGLHVRSNEDFLFNQVVKYDTCLEQNKSMIQTTLLKTTSQEKQLKVLNRSITQQNNNIKYIKQSLPSDTLQVPN